MPKFKIKTADWRTEGYPGPVRYDDIIELEPIPEDPEPKKECRHHDQRGRLKDGVFLCDRCSSEAKDPVDVVVEWLAKQETLTNAYNTGLEDIAKKLLAAGVKWEDLK